MNDEIGKLLGNPLFENLTRDEAVSLLERCAVRRFTEGEVVFGEGDLSREAYVVLDGCLGVRKRVMDKMDDRASLMPVIAENMAGELVGEFSFFDARPRSCEVFAISDASALVISPETFQRFSGEYPQASQRIMNNIVRLLIARVRKTDRQLAIALEWGWKTHDFEIPGDGD